MNQEQHTAKKITSLLDQSLVDLDQEVATRLTAARHRAVRAASLQTQQQTAFSLAFSQTRVAMLFADYKHRPYVVFSALVVAAALLAAFFVVPPFSPNSAITQGDAFLLASDLPPEAYLDKNFDQWLDSSSR